MVIPDEFRSQPFTIICYTYNETLEWLRCCGLPELVQVTKSWCEKWNTGQANFNTYHEPEHDEVITLEPPTHSQ